MPTVTGRRPVAVLRLRCREGGTGLLPGERGTGLLSGERGSLARVPPSAAGSGL
jgi:hypothetical protein